MLRELTPGQIRQLQNALLDALSRGELQQVTFSAIGKPMQQIVPPGNLGDEAFDLIMWANRQRKIGDLLREARKAAPNNPRLQELERILTELPEPNDEPPDIPAPASLPPRDLVRSLPGLLARVPICATFAGRSILLHGIPGADVLNRAEGSAMLDLSLIVSQLVDLGPLDSGASPLSLVTENAAGYVKGTTLATELRTIGRLLNQRLQIGS
jgi:hypothetical protein